MAGEWIPYDVCLATKPEVLELLDETGASADAVIGRLLQFWGWAALNAEGGTARMTIDRLGRMFGGDAHFWNWVEKVGWLAVDSAGGTVSIPGWENRFSKTAKARALQQKRSAYSHECGPVDGVAPGAGRSSARTRAQDRPRGERGNRGERAKRGEETEETGLEPSASSSVENTPEEDSAAWETLRAAWRQGPGKAWPSQTPPEKLEDRLREPGWLPMALRAIERLPGCKYFQSPVGLGQLVSKGFVDKIVAGDFDTVNRGASTGGDRLPADNTNKKYYRAQFGRSMTEREFREADRLPAGEGADSLEAARLKTLKMLKRESGG